jgi:hypothetical protein
MISNPFGPDGAFAENIRTTIGDLAELRESMKEFGWVPEFPAYADEHGVLLVGHRRCQIADELGIPKVIVTLTLGNGDVADAERLKLALVSNVGHAPLTKEDRQRIAQVLYAPPHEWTIERIAQALKTSKSSVGRDVSNFPTVGKSSHAKTTANPKGAGRPKGSKLAPERRKNTSTEAEQAASMVLDEGKTYPEVEAATGLSSTVLRSAIAREEGRREARTEPDIDRAILSMSAQQKLDAAIRQEKRRLETEFNERLRDAVRKWMNEVRLPDLKEKHDHYERVIKARRGVMTRAVYRKIWSCLHPDRIERYGDPELTKLFQEAFHLFSNLELVLLNEIERPTPITDFPRTMEEWDARKAQVQAERRAKRQQQRSAREAG